MTPPDADANVLVPVDEPMESSEVGSDEDAEGDLVEETDEIVSVSSTAVSPIPIPIPAPRERPVRGVQRAIRGRGTRAHPYVVGFAPVRPFGVDPKCTGLESPRDRSSSRVSPGHLSRLDEPSSELPWQSRGGSYPQLLADFCCGGTGRVSSLVAIAAGSTGEGIC